MLHPVLDDLEYPVDCEEFVSEKLYVLESLYKLLHKISPYTPPTYLLQKAESIITELQQKGVRIKENFETPLDAAPGL
jgi:hypothetical protein